MGRGKSCRSLSWQRGCSSPEVLLPYSPTHSIFLFDESALKTWVDLVKVDYLLQALILQKGVSEASFYSKAPRQLLVLLCCPLLWLWLLLGLPPCHIGVLASGLGVRVQVDLSRSFLSHSQGHLKSPLPHEERFSHVGFMSLASSCKQMSISLLVSLEEQGFGLLDGGGAQRQILHF